MAGPQINAAGISKLVGQLRTASSAGERNMSTVSDLLSALEEIRDQIQAGLEGLRSSVEELRTESQQAGDETESAIQSLTAAAQAGTGERLPAAAEGLAQGLSSAATSHEGEHSRLEEFAETLREQGFEELAAALGVARNEHTEASSAASAAFSDLEGEREDAQQGLLTAESDTVEQFESTVSGLEGETTQGLDSDTESAVSELESQGAASEQGAAQTGAQLQEAYAQWTGAHQQERQRLLTSVSEAVEATNAAVLEAALDHLDDPCTAVAQNHVTTATAELEGVGGAADEWQQSCADLSTAAGELERGHDAKRRIDQLVRGGS